MDNYKYKIIEIAADMAADDGKDYDKLSEKEQLDYYGKAYKDYLDRDTKALGGSMRLNYASGGDDEQRLKDMLRDIEAGEIIEDIVDPEDYEDMGGIKSLDRGAPSIKMASETPIEEFNLELDSVYQEYLDKLKKGEFDGSFEDFAIQYFSAKRAMKDKRKMAMYGGRMQYANGSKDYEDRFMKLVAELREAGFSQQEAIEEARKRLSKDMAMGGRIQYAEGNKDPGSMGNPAVMKKIENMREYKIMNPDSEDVADYSSFYKKKKKQDDEIKRMLDKAKKEKIKRAKGGIAGVL